MIVIIQYKYQYAITLEKIFHFPVDNAIQLLYKHNYGNSAVIEQLEGNLIMTIDTVSQAWLVLTWMAVIAIPVIAIIAEIAGRIINLFGKE